MKQKKSRGVLWKVFLIILAIIFFSVLELGKHTVYGWILTAVLVAGFAVLAQKKLSKLEKHRKGWFFLSWAGLLVVFAVILAVSWPPVRAVPAVEAKDPKKTEIVHVQQGDIRGVCTGDELVEVFAGIPYAKPPVGELRWREPQKADSWDGVLEADHFAPMSMQTQNLPIYDSLAQIIGYHDYKISLNDNYRAPVSEDSLYLNIWRPAGTEAGAGLPVMVYIHGGSLQTGQPWYQDYSGEGLAREGAIVVNMGYRLGIFGFFASEELAGESENSTTGNYGLLDQIMALEWVRDNIEAFGGDPSNVTLSGESAGSACVTSLCTSPLARGLFRRVLAESSTVTAPSPAHSFRLLDDALKAGVQTMEKYGAKNIEELRAVPAERIAGELSVHHHITIDGYVLAETPYESYKNGRFNEEVQLQGYNREEAAPFILFSQANLKNYEQKIKRAFGEYSDRVLALFPAETNAQARQQWADINSAYLFNYGHYCWQRQAAANGIPAYTYYFTKDNGRLGSWHSGEEVYFYGNIPEGSGLYDDTDRQLSASIVKYILNYMKTGDPNGDGLPEWKQGDPDKVLQLGNTINMDNAPYTDLFKIMDEMYGWSD